MKLSVLALDYDGTLTCDDGPDPSALSAIAYARRRNVIVMLVTGRILDDLRRVAGELRFVDGVVAENGAVVHFHFMKRPVKFAPRLGAARSFPDTPPVSARSPFNQPRGGARERVTPISRQTRSSSLLQRGDSPFYSRSSWHVTCRRTGGFEGEAAPSGARFSKAAT